MTVFAAALDVGYRDDAAVAAAVVFEPWGSPAAVEERMVRIAPVAAYEPGRFYLRELPCLLQVLQQVECPLGVLIIDGYVTLGAEQRPGLGHYLWEALDRSVSVIGVAKTAFAGTPDTQQLLRPGSARPLWITAAGLPLADARQHVANLHGPFRIPTLLRRADQLSRSAP